MEPKPEWLSSPKYDDMLRDINDVDGVKKVMGAVMLECERMHDRLIMVEKLLSDLKTLTEKYNGNETPA